MNVQMSSTGRGPICLPTAKLQCTTIMIQSGDIKLNPGPRQASIFTCGMCEIPVTWSNEGVCCDCMQCVAPQILHRTVHNRLRVTTKVKRTMDVLQMRQPKRLLVYLPLIRDRKCQLLRTIKHH